MEDKGAACTCGWLNRHVVSGQRPEPRIRNATPAGLSSLFCVDRIEIEGALLLAFDSTIEAAACTYEPLMEPT
jgi:hypothetical protein